MPCRTALCCIFALSLLAACSVEPAGPLPVTPVVAQVSTQSPIPAAGGAESPAIANLAAAEQRLSAGDRQAALNLLNTVEYARLPVRWRSKYNLLEARIALAEADIAHALLMLKTAQPQLLSVADQQLYYRDLAEVHADTGDHLAALAAKIHLLRLETDPERKAAIVNGILDSLQTMPRLDLDARIPQSDALHGWLQLARILRRPQASIADFNEQFKLWQLKFPGYPVTAAALQSYLAQLPAARIAGRPMTTPGIAVLLPASGEHAAAGDAVREGLQIARELAGGAQLPLYFYDSEQADVAELYNRAIAAGATWVIGPLLREQVQVLAELPSLPVPVLALNQIDAVGHDNLYRFPLSPLDEVAAIVHQARIDGRQAAIVLADEGSQGHKLGDLLSTAWAESGGKVVAVRHYAQRYPDIRTLLADIPAVAGDRPDTVLLAANPETGRQLVKQLKNHLNGNLAIYALPSIHDMHVEPLRDTELGGVTFCDMPWLLDDYSGPYSRSALAGNRHMPADGQLRLLALGIDAFNWLQRLPAVSTGSYGGVTGRLTLGTDRRIIRTLVCARYAGGIPQKTGYSE